VASSPPYSLFVKFTEGLQNRAGDYEPAFFSLFVPPSLFHGISHIVLPILGVVQ
jgi:hypothetical protein